MKKSQSSDNDFSTLSVRATRLSKWPLGCQSNRIPTLLPPLLTFWLSCHCELLKGPRLCCYEHFRDSFQMKACFQQQRSQPTSIREHRLLRCCGYSRHTPMHLQSHQEYANETHSYGFPFDARLLRGSGANAAAHRCRFHWNANQRAVKRA